MIKTYYLLTKPGIILGNLITTAAGFVLASKPPLDYTLFFIMMVGLGLVIASACVFNNYIDRFADQKMERTKNRPLAQGLIGSREALTFASLLCIVGLGILYMYTNPLTVLTAFCGFFVYVVLYSLWKYHTIYGTLIGSISGALPPVIGYCAAGNRLDMGAFLLFSIIVLWQMPHFYSIAAYRLDDYTKAAIPVLPVERGMYITKMHMVFYILAFILATALLTLFGYTGVTYLVIATGLGLSWLILCLKGFSSINDKRWARQMFFLSLVVIIVNCSLMIYPIP